MNFGQADLAWNTNSPKVDPELISNAAALVGSVLGIKPVLYVPDGGTLDVVKKARGRKAALHAILDGVFHDLSKVADPTGLRIHILQADCRGDAEFVRDSIRAAYTQMGEITITSLGVVIGAHCGPPGCGHWRALRARSADDILSLQRQKPRIKKQRPVLLNTGRFLHCNFTH